MYRITNQNKELIIGDRSLIMGIINCTPDSFSGDGIYKESKTSATEALKMVTDGADIIDIGGESSRPGAKQVLLEEELERVIPVISEIRKHSNVWISIDTSKAAVADKAIENGADIINDISGLTFDPEMLNTARLRKVPVVIMHMKGNPETMQENPEYDEIITEISNYFEERIDYSTSNGIEREKLILDPGIGFGKNLKHNLQIINNLDKFRKFGLPLMIGTSKKSFIGKVIKDSDEDRIEGSLASVSISVYNGADIIRVHDVMESKKAVLVADAIARSRKTN